MKILSYFAIFIVINIVKILSYFAIFIVINFMKILSYFAIFIVINFVKILSYFVICIMINFVKILSYFAIFVVINFVEILSYFAISIVIKSRHHSELLLVTEKIVIQWQHFNSISIYIYTPISFIGIFQIQIEIRLKIVPTDGVSDLSSLVR